VVLAVHFGGSVAGLNIDVNAYRGTTNSFSRYRGEGTRGTGTIEPDTGNGTRAAGSGETERR
jgi:hypothetical protein